MTIAPILSCLHPLSLGPPARPQADRNQRACVRVTLTCASCHSCSPRPSEIAIHDCSRHCRAQSGARFSKLSDLQRPSSGSASSSPACSEYCSSDSWSSPSGIPAALNVASRWNKRSWTPPALNPSAKGYLINVILFEKVMMSIPYDLVVIIHGICIRTALGVPLGRGWTVGASCSSGAMAAVASHALRCPLSSRMPSLGRQQRLRSEAG